MLSKLYTVIAKTEHLVAVLMDIDMTDGESYSMAVWSKGSDVGRVVYYPADAPDDLWFKPAVTCGDMCQSDIYEMPDIYNQIRQAIKEARG